MISLENDFFFVRHEHGVAYADHLGRARVTIVLAKSVFAEELGVYGLVVVFSSIYVLVAGWIYTKAVAVTYSSSKSRRSGRSLFTSFR